MIVGCKYKQINTAMQWYTLQRPGLRTGVRSAYLFRIQSGFANDRTGVTVLVQKSIPTPKLKILGTDGVRVRAVPSYRAPLILRRRPQRRRHSVDTVRGAPAHAPNFPDS